MAKMRVRATIVFWPPLSCCIVCTSPMPKDTLTLTPLYFSCVSVTPSSSSTSSTASPGSRFCITSSPRPPGASSEKISLKFLATCLNVRSMASSLRMSSDCTSSLILTSPLCSSFCLLRRSSRCSVNVTYWSSAFLFTWLNCLSSSATCFSMRCSSLVDLLRYFSNASVGRLPSSRMRLEMSSRRWVYCVRFDSSVSRIRSWSAACSSSACFSATAVSIAFFSS
mmetsp:Transcript_35617/g.90936  ORF Transcript_35617/g.90936 Transcript_35617/m.90936 type:complete len:224 (+) Transcript_35617:570-1241(+)